MPQQHLARLKAGNGMVMTKEVDNAYQRDNVARRKAAFANEHCDMKAKAYYTYITTTPKDKQTHGCILSIQRRVGLRDENKCERIKHAHKWE
jgi:hypothetical protein